MSIKIERVFNGYVVTDYDFGEEGMSRKIVIEELDNEHHPLEELKANRNLLYTIVDLLGLRFQSTDERYSIILEIKDDEGVIISDNF